jgi:hypothetical protein
MRSKLTRRSPTDASQLRSWCASAFSAGPEQRSAYRIKITSALRPLSRRRRSIEAAALQNEELVHARRRGASG